MNESYRRNHPVLDEIARLALHQATALPETSGVHRKNRILVFQLIYPSFDFLSLQRILPACQLDSQLQFAHCYGRKESLFASECA